MVNFLKPERVNIDHLPTVDTQQLATEGVEITIGDLHANPIKFLFLLCKHGIATNLLAEDYDKLVKLYKKAPNLFTAEDLQCFNELLNKIKLESKALIRLIGDETADRGQNDYFILKILQKLRQHNVPYEILISNHGAEFVEAYETKNDFIPPRLQAMHAQSAFNLQHWIDRGLIQRREVDQLIEEAYLPALKALSYSLSTDGKHITLYSHAGIGLNTIREIAAKLKVTYSDKTAYDLAQSIDRIHSEFAKHVKNHTIHRLYDSENMLKGYQGLELRHCPFEFLMWNRRYDRIERPENHNHYLINYAHGHDQELNTAQHIINLDNDLGKTIAHDPGIYHVLFTTETGPYDAQIHFTHQLNVLRKKAIELRVNSHIKAAKTANELHDKLKEQAELYFSEKINFEVFQTRSHQIIAEARPELETHRGWKQVLGNLALAILGLGALYGIAILLNKSLTGNFLFFKTDSAQKLDELASHVNNMIIK